MTSVRKPKAAGREWPIPASLFLGLTLLNACLVSPFIGWYDSGEMVGATACLGISHPSGQVLFHLLGKIFLFLPWGTPAWRLGLMSAVCSALAAVLFWVLGCRLAAQMGDAARPPSFTLKLWLALLTLAWSLSQPWWVYSLTPLVYALHLLLGLLVLWALSLERPGKWFLAFFILGVATVFRPTQFFALPFVGVAYLRHLYRGGVKTAGKNKSTSKKHQNGTPHPNPSSGWRPQGKSPVYPSIRKAQGARGIGNLLGFHSLSLEGRGRGEGEKSIFRGVLKNITLTVICFALGRSTLLYLPLRSALRPDIAYGDLTHPMALVRHVLALKFSNSVGANSLHNILHVAGMMAGRFWTDLTPFGLGLLLWGACVVYWKREKIPVFLWVALGWGIVEGLFVFTIPFPTFEPHQVLLGWVYGGLVAALPLIFMEQIFRKRLARSAVMDILLVAFVLAQLSYIGHLWERKKERGAEDYGRNLLAIMAPNALYVPTEENEYFPAVGYQQSFGFRKDIEVLEPGQPASVLAGRIEEALKGGRPLYMTRKWDLPPAWSYRLWGPLLQVVPAVSPQNLGPAPKLKPLAAWGGLELVGVDLWPAEVRAGGIAKITFRWVRRKAGVQDSSDLVLALFIDGHGNYWTRNGVFWLHDIHSLPAGPPSRMKPGLVYEDTQVLFIPSDYPPGDYALAVGLQKQEPVEKGRESFSREFYERNAAQDLDKFMGRGENGAVVQFSAGGNEAWKSGLWPVTKSRYPIADPRFVPVAKFQIQPEP